LLKDIVSIITKLTEYGYEISYAALESWFLSSKPGVAGWRLKPARRGSEQQGVSEGKAFPSIKKENCY
jgi:hypothetical protein